MRVIRAEDPSADLEDGLVFDFGLVKPTEIFQDDGEIITGDQGTGMLGTERFGTSPEDRLVLGQSFGQVTLIMNGDGEIITDR